MSPFQAATDYSRRGQEDKGTSTKRNPEDRRRQIRPGLRTTADRAFSRAAGAPLVEGNRVGLLKDGKENYPAWLEAIKEATKTVHFESYIIHSDDIGNQFAEAMRVKARDGVRIRVIHDWLGAQGTSSWGF